jgi:nicotinate-nucleotide adenylyltransferase
MTSAPRSGRLGLLGGTLDPIHYGHLDAAHAAKAALGLDEVLFIPSYDPPHRPIDPRTSAFHRFALTALAIDGCDGFRASDLEVTRHGPSYTADTLRALHQDGWAAAQLFFVIGADAFAEIATWYAYPALMDWANFVVIARPGSTLASALARTPALAPRVRGQMILGQTGVRQGSDPEWRSVSNREDGSQGAGATGIFLVEAVTRDVSSTAVRQRLASGQAVDDLVPAAVARHIQANDLYRAVDQLHG